MANQVTWKDVNFAVGDTIRINQTFEEGDKTRTQIFEGLVIAIRGHEHLKSFVIRRIATNNVGVEKIFPIETPTIIKIEVKKKGNVRRAKLYFLRDRIGKKANKVKGLFVKGSSTKEGEAETVVRKATKERPVAGEQPVKNKVAKADKPIKEKKVKKGPKKIVRKERQFVR